jgi:acyl-CoA reductase-like NAD-dependent aldehyde dehydrogenase
MQTHETATPVRAFDRAYINGQFITPHGTQIVDLVNPTDNKVIGKVTMADEIDTRKAIGAAKEAFNTFSQSSKAYRMELLQQLHDSVARRMDQLGIAKEEIFGPVLSILAYKTEAEAIEIADDTEFGLIAYVIGGPGVATQLGLRPRLA